MAAKELREYTEVRGDADAADWVYRQAIQSGAWSGGDLLSLTELRQIPPSRARARLVSLAALTDDRITVDALRVAALRGRLQAVGCSGTLCSHPNQKPSTVSGEAHSAMRLAGGPLT